MDCTNCVWHKETYHFGWDKDKGTYRCFVYDNCTKKHRSLTDIIKEYENCVHKKLKKEV